MVEGGKQLSEADLGRLARLHVGSIEDSLPTLIGVPFAVEFYRFVAESPHEFLFVDRLGEDIVGACVVSDEPESVYGRTLRRTFWSLAWHSLRALRTNPSFRAFVRAFLGERLRAAIEPMPGPEIAYLFTASEHRRRGLGRRMVERVDAWLEARDASLYWVQTMDSPSNRAISFYERNGFARAGSRRECGKDFVLFQKALEAC